MKPTVRTMIRESISEPIVVECGAYQIAAISIQEKDKLVNEDALAIISMGNGGAILAVADGVGGHRNGQEAAKIAIDEVARAVGRLQPKENYRAEILNVFENANAKVMRDFSGAGTTLLIVELQETWLRYYCAGDSVVEIIGGKGKKKYRSIGHSSFDLGVEAGLIESSDSASKDDDLRNIITNLIGAKDMRVEIGSKHPVADRDLIILASDGLFDNIDTSTCLHELKNKTPKSVCQSLADLAQKQMYNDRNDGYSKPDDLSIICVMKMKK